MIRRVNMMNNVDKYYKYDIHNPISDGTFCEII